MTNRVLNVEAKTPEGQSVGFFIDVPDSRHGTEPEMRIAMLEAAVTSLQSQVTALQIELQAIDKVTQ